ncbi:MAG: DUF3047 domain-containing protein, partial [Wenzhouxiangella sp.]|nr:DUF3047 domain-containing protein [Wenzhouxiangella sp.]
ETWATVKHWLAANERLFDVNLAFQALLFWLALAAATDAPLHIWPRDFIEGEARAFADPTDYRLAGPDETAVDHAAVHARCRAGQASGLFVEREIKLQDHPILEWRWRVDDIFEDLDETSKAGDDYPARIYVVAERWPRFRSRVINYVWSSAQPENQTWENAFAAQFQMVAVRSGQADLGRWVEERRNVRDDFRRLHGIEPDVIDAVAIMTDCDNAGQQTNAWYGPVKWLPDDR